MTASDCVSCPLLSWTSIIYQRGIWHWPRPSQTPTCTKLKTLPRYVLHLLNLAFSGLYLVDFLFL